MPNSRADHDAAIVARADLFRVCRPLGCGVWERHNVKTFSEAETIAQFRADETGKAYMIYAQVGLEGCHVKNVLPKPR